MKIVKYILLILSFQINLFSGGWAMSPQDKSFSIFHDTFTRHQTPVSSRNFNLTLWKKLLPHWTEEEILNRNKNALSGHFWWTHNKPIDQKVRTYLELQNSSTHVTACSDRAWDYRYIIGEKEVRNFDQLIQNTRDQLEQETNQQMKQRYAYLYSRLLFMSKAYQKGVLFYHNVLQGLEKNEIYFQAVDYAAGCFYALKQYETAADMYYEVLLHSGDKKNSARNSLNLCFSKMPALLKKFVVNKKDFQFYLLKGKVKFPDYTFFLEKALELGIDSEKLCPIVVNAVQSLETHFLKVNQSFETKERLVKAKQLEQLKRIIDSVLTQPQLKNREFWEISNSYCHFMQKNIKAAMRILNKIKPDKLKQLHRQLKVVYLVSLWDKMTDGRELFLAQFFSKEDFKRAKVSNYERASIEKWKFYILDYVSHLYYKNSQFVKSILVFHPIDKLNRCSSQSLLTQAMKLAGKAPNRFEALLLDSETNPLEQIQLFQAFLSLRRFDIENAYLWTQKIDDSSNLLKKDYPFTIFSNAILYKNLNDPKYIAENNDFLQKLVKLLNLNLKKEQWLQAEKCVNYKTLFNLLHQLNKLSKSTDKDQRFTANYALGNFFINTANQGKYRNCFLPHRYRREYGNSGQSINEFESSMIQQKVFNLRTDNLRTNSYFGHCRFAKRFYNQALRSTKNKEEQAKCLYFIAQAEYYQFESEKSANDFYYDIEKEPVKSVRETFLKIEKDYPDCQFTKKVIKECSRFRYYRAF